MSVFSTLEAVPKRLDVLWNVLRDAGDNGIERDELQRIIAPGSLGSTSEDDNGESNVFKGSLDEFVRSGFAQIVRKSVKLKDAESDSFLACVEHLLLSPTTKVDSKQGYLAGSVAWFLTREPTSPLLWGSAPHEELRADFGGAPKGFELGNLSSWQNFAYWARFLGYATVVEIGKQVPVIIPDPKEALSRHLVRVLPPGQELQIGTILNALATTTPVFEDGTARQAIETRLVRSRREDRTLSLATSLALRRLQMAAFLQPIRHDDAEIWITPGLHDGRVSHLRRR